MRISPETYDTFFPGAAERREMFQYYEEYTYFGPGNEERIRSANALVPGGFTGFLPTRPTWLTAPWISFELR